MKTNMAAGRDLDVVTFGETMWRLSPPGHTRLEEAVSLDVRIGGAESNTAVALARLGLRIAWWSKLPANPLGRRIENEIRRWGVDTSGVLWEESPPARAGVYFLDFGAAPRGIDVYYDRAGSAASAIAPEEVDAQTIARARLLHLTGITPALSPACARATAQAISLARLGGTAVSFDVNFRARLWTPEAAQAALEPLLAQVDVLLCPLRDAATVFGLTGEGPQVARQLRARFSAGAVVVTLGEEGAVACDDRGDRSVASLPIGSSVDRVGAGDAFCAGVLMGFLQADLALGLEYGVAMAALKHTMPGDLLLSTRAE
ncbi:MAG TPA: sugar kinase, partial [Chthonomonadaceae bacterium]|nr:sugar kinase [Chthonomonadaceae bacterium]